MSMPTSSRVTDAEAESDADADPEEEAGRAPAPAPPPPPPPLSPQHRKSSPCCRPFPSFLFAESADASDRSAAASAAFPHAILTGTIPPRATSSGVLFLRCFALPAASSSSARRAGDESPSLVKSQRGCRRCKMAAACGSRRAGAGARRRRPLLLLLLPFPPPLAPLGAPTRAAPAPPSASPTSALMYPPVSTPRWSSFVRGESSWRTLAGSTVCCCCCCFCGGDEVWGWTGCRGGSGTIDAKLEEERSSSHVKVATGQRVLGTLPRSGVAMMARRPRTARKPDAPARKRVPEENN